MTIVNNKMKELVDKLMEVNGSIKKRKIACPLGEITLLYVPQLTDRIMLSDYVIRPLLVNVQQGGKKFDAETVSSSILQFDDLELSKDFAQVEEKILNGMTILLLPDKDQYIIINAKKVEKKSIESPQVSYSLRGAKDSFTENMDTNLSLVRYRMKDNNLQTDDYSIGQRTKTNIAMMYLKDVANENVLQRIKDKLDNINVDGIIDSGELQKFLSEQRFSFFPEMGVIERSDMACGALLEGKIVILVEGSSLALVAPKVFVEFFTSGDDLYDNKYFAIYARLLRYLAVFCTVFLTPLYVAVVSFNTEILSADYAITLASLRANVPFNAFTETLILVVMVELLRECFLRVPKQIGSAIGVAGAIIIGQSAVAAGIFSPLILIIAALSLLTSFVSPDYTSSNPFRIVEVLLIIATGVFGFLGFTMGVCVFITKLISTKSFGVPIMAPYAPFNLKDTIKTFFYSIDQNHERPHFLRTKDQVNGRMVE